MMDVGLLDTRRSTVVWVTGAHAVKRSEAASVARAAGTAGSGRHVPGTSASSSIRGAGSGVLCQILCAPLSEEF